MHGGTEGRKVCLDLVGAPFRVRLERACERKSPGLREFMSASDRGQLVCLYLWDIG